MINNIFGEFDTDNIMDEVDQLMNQLSRGVPAEKLAPPKPIKKQHAPGERMHILVVDDDVRMLKLIKRYLDTDYDIATAVNGTVALRFLMTKKTDLILLDYEMPEMTGPEVLEKIRENEKTKDIPVIFLTGASERRKINKALSLKPEGYLLKPIERDALVTKIADVIG